MIYCQLERYGIRGMTNKSFKFYLFGRKQFAFINGHVSNQGSVKYIALQGSFLGPLLFLIYINDLNQSTKVCKVHHFADDANLIHFSK